MDGVRSGRTTGTAAALNIESGFIPARVELTCGEGTLCGFWDESMRPGSFLMNTIGFMVAGGGIYGSILPYIGSTDTQVATGRCAGIFVDAQTTPITIPAVTAGDAFTATTHDIDADKWGSFLHTVDHDGTTFTLTASSSLDHDTEAQALADLASIPSNEAVVGIITIKATSAILWNATTDALAGGSSGTPAEETNYYPGMAVVTNGVSVYGDDEGDSFQGFTIGTSALLNVLYSDIYWKAYRD